MKVVGECDILSSSLDIPFTKCSWYPRELLTKMSLHIKNKWKELCKHVEGPEFLDSHKSWFNTLSNGKFGNINVTRILHRNNFFSFA